MSSTVIAGVHVELLDNANSIVAASSDSKDLKSFDSTASSESFTPSKFNLVLETEKESVIRCEDVSELLGLLEERAGASSDGKPGAKLWLDCQGASIEEIKAVCDAAFGGFHPLSLDILQRPRTQHRDALQELKSYFFATFGPNNAIVSFANGAISLSRSQNSHFHDVMRKLKTTLPFEPEYICCAILVEQTESLQPAIDQLDKNANWVSEQTYVGFEGVSGQSLLDRLSATRKDAVYLTQQIRGRLEVVQSVKQRWSQRELRVHLENMENFLTALKFRVDAHEALLGHTHRNWMAVTQMNLEKTKSKILVVVGQFLALATIFIPMLTVFTAAHMNLEGPNMDGSKTGLGYWGAMNGITVGVASLLVFASYLYFRSIMNRPAPSLTGQ